MLGASDGAHDRTGPVNPLPREVPRQAGLSFVMKIAALAVTAIVLGTLPACAQDRGFGDGGFLLSPAADKTTK